MRNKVVLICASGTLIVAMLACNMFSGQVEQQPNLAATITAQALELQALTPTSGSADTTQPTDTPPAATVRPSDTPLPSAPPKPQNFQSHGSAASIQFSWDDSSIDETGFRIYQEGVAAPVASVEAHTATGGMSFNWTGLSCGFKGKFSVRAFNTAGESGSSNAVNGVTVPCTPTSLIANGQENTISFNWAVVNPHNEDGFRIYQQGVSSPVASRGPNLGSGGTNYDMTGLFCNLVATYSVTAFNGAGESAPSNLVQAETVPCGPSGFTVTGTTRDTVNYTWTDNGTSETGYHVYVDDVLYATLPSSSPMNLTGAMSNDAFQFCGQTHVYAVRAFNYAGESSWSEHVGATTLACP